MNTKRILIVGSLILLGWVITSCGGESKNKEAEGSGVHVEVAKAKLQNQTEVLSFSGKLEARDHSNLSTRMMGQIVRIHVEAGQKVKAGELLVQIRNKDILAKKAQLKANLAEAEAAFDNAEKDYQRFKVLFEQKSASQKELDDMTTRYDMAKARLSAVREMQAEVEENLRYANIKAPYDGVITRKYLNEGDMASPGMPLVAIEKPSQFQIMARIPESEITKVAKGDLVKVKINALEGLMVDGKVVEVNPSALYTGNQYEAKVLLSPSGDQKEKLYSGMYATVLLKKGGMPSIMVPKKVLLQRGQLTGLYTVSQGGTALLRWVRTGKEMGDAVEITSGLSDGEQYIVSWEGKISDGTKVVVRK